MDKLLSAFMLANAAASLGAPVTMFFTFWGLAALKRQTVYRRKSAAERLMNVMLPADLRRLNPSRGSLLGWGRRLFGALLQRRHMQNLEGLRRQARELKVRMVACETVMQMLGVTRDELMAGVEFGGAVSFLDEALGRSATLFI